MNINYSEENMKDITVKSLAFNCPHTTIKREKLRTLQTLKIFIVFYFPVVLRFAVTHGEYRRARKKIFHNIK